MARLSDHTVRDAEHALRAEIALTVGPYIRRMAELGKAYIQEALEEAAKNEEDVNGTAVGRAAAQRAASSYFTLPGAEHPAIEGSVAGAE